VRHAGGGAGRGEDRGAQGCAVQAEGRGGARMCCAAGEARRARQWKYGGQAGTRTVEGRDGASRDEAMRERTIQPNKEGLGLES
jgi:hypothetical protein